MKKLILLTTSLFVFNLMTAQVSVGPRHIGTSKKFPKDRVEKFKKTETQFVLSDIIDSDVYEKILDGSWDITPYQLIDHNQFDVLNYLEDDYSFAALEGHHVTKTTKSGATVHYIYIYLNFYMLDREELKKDLSKLKKSHKKYKSKVKKAINSNRLNIARVDLFPKDNFIATALKSDSQEIMDTIYNNDVFYNYKAGFLKNYFQKVNDQVKTGESYWMYDNDNLPELKKLAKSTLYIPNYHLIKYNPWRMTDKKNKEDFDKVFDSYDYTFEFQDEAELDKRILAGEEFYYLRFVRVNSQKFVHIVNSKTGEIVYRNYVAGMMSSYNLKSRHIKDINSKIKRALKK